MLANVMFLRTFSVGLLSYHNFQSLTLSDFFATLILGYIWILFGEPTWLNWPKKESNPLLVGRKAELQ